ncbi:MAG: MATE family efflux transporter [Halobacteriovoraceae bacterium]|nr:MATE family efflux transporter [Halobacteriovoraceae bacterium]|tara:strand:+ start:12088 stop:13431 length:1344 start_codon:yes stop_codon:yes gene_type:complete
MNRQLLDGHITKNLLSMTLSMGVGIFSVITFNLADAYFVAKLGKIDLAALSLTFPVVNFFFSLAMGAGFAVTAVVSKAIGEGDSESVKRYTSDGLTFGMIIVLICVTFGFLFLKPILKSLGATAETMPLAYDYMSIWLAGFVFLTIPMVGNGAIKAKGHMKTAAGLMVGSAFMNIILDPIFIFGFGPLPAMGMKGAAVASVIARAATLVLSLGILHFKYRMISFKVPEIATAIASWKKITHIAIPISSTNILSPLAIAVATGMIARLGTTELATYGIVSRLESFAFIFFFALSNALGPFVGQNFGAKQYRRLFLSVNISFKMCFFWSAAAFVILYSFGRGLIGLFTPDLEMMNMGWIYLSLVPLSYPFFGIRVLSSTILSTIGEPIKAAYIAIVHFIFLFIPLISYGTFYYQFEGVAYAYFFTYLIIGFLCIFYVKYLLTKKLYASK